MHPLCHTQTIWFRNQFYKRIFDTEYTYDYIDISLTTFKCIFHTKQPWTQHVLESGHLLVLPHNGLLCPKVYAQTGSVGLEAPSQAVRGTSSPWIESTHIAICVEGVASKTREEDAEEYWSAAEIFFLYILDISMVSAVQNINSNGTRSAIKKNRIENRRDATLTFVIPVRLNLPPFG